MVLPWIAAECGWILAEYGRQPWAVEGVLPVFLSVSDLSAGTVLMTVIGFTLIYATLIVIEVKLMLAAIRKGPQPDYEPEAPLIPKPIVTPAE